MAKICFLHFFVSPEDIIYLILKAYKIILRNRTLIDINEKSQLFSIQRVEEWIYRYN